MATDTAVVGATKRLTFTFTDVNDDAADPTSITLTIRQPDGTEVSKSEADMTGGNSPVDGIWYYDFAVTQEGRHHAHCDGDGAVEAATQIEFYALRKTTS